MGECLEIALQIAQGLQCIHDKEIIHLDLKSDNILYMDAADNRRRYKISDFGIAKFIQQYKTSTGLSGSINWDAPEKFNESAVPRPSMDIYSFGCVIFEILTKKIPFQGLD